MLSSKIHQIDFSSVLFDTLFGLVLYFSLDSFLEIQNPIHFVFYLFSIVILIHWWLMFKSVDDMFDNEVTDSGMDIIIGIIELVLLDYLVLTSRSFDYMRTGWFLVALLLVDLLWTMIWRYVGTWRTADLQKIKSMENELDRNLKALVIGLFLMSIFTILSPIVSPVIFVTGFMGSYIVYIALTFRYKIIDIKIF